MRDDVEVSERKSLMDHITPLEMDIIDFIIENGNVWTSPTVIGKAIKFKGYLDPNPSLRRECMRLVKKGALERNQSGKYKICWTQTPRAHTWPNGGDLGYTRE